MHKEKKPWNSSGTKIHFSKKQLLNLLLNCCNLRFYLGSLVLSNTGCYDRPAYTTGSSEGLFGSNKNEGHILILAQQWDMKKNLQWFTVSCKDNKFSLTPIQSFRSFISSLSQLLIVRSLLNEIQYFGSESLLCKRISFGVDFPM